VGSATVFGEKAEDLLGKMRGGRRVAEKIVDVLSLSGGRDRWGTEAEVEREAKRATNGRDTADYIRTVNRAAVPSIGRSVSCFDKNFIGTTVVSSNSDSFIEKTMKFFHTDSFMVALGGK
jgi:hypothetical protein